MISEYHMACMTRGSPVTSPIFPGEIEDWLPPLTDYTPDYTTDVRVRDHHARTLQVAIWFHRLDMALSEEPATSGSLVRTQHHLGHLLAYFLGPGTAWELQFEDVVTQVLKENQRHNEKRCTDVASSLWKCLNRQIQLHKEFDSMSGAMEMITNVPSSRELEHRLNTLQTSLNKVERSITKFENLIEDCQMLEEEARCMEEDEAHMEEEIRQEQEEEEVTNAEMADEEECGDPEPSTPHGEADTEGPFWPLLKMLSPLRRMPSSCSQHPNPKIQLLDLTVPGVRPVWSWERWPS